MKNFYLIAVLFLIVSCRGNRFENRVLSKAEMMSIVKNCDKQFRLGIQKKDSSILVGMYSDSAQYIIPQNKIITGKYDIGREWSNFLRLKEQPVDLILNINEVRGNREIIYETGEGYTLLADSSKWTFHYVNVWRLQKDGTYKLEIDTYN